MALMVISQFSLVYAAEQKTDIVTVTANKEVVIYPDTLSLNVRVNSPMLSTPKQFTMSITISGSAYFDDNSKTKTIIYDEIKEAQETDYTINIDKAASGSGEMVTISYNIKYKSSSWGRIDENFDEYSNSISFTAISTEKSVCEEDLKKCETDKNSLHGQISTLNSDKLALQQRITTLEQEKTSVETNLTECQVRSSEKIEDCNSITFGSLTIPCGLLLILTIVFFILWIKEKNKPPRIVHNNVNQSSHGHL